MGVPDCRPPNKSHLCWAGFFMSIGSNIFDVAVGLPFPWLLFNLSTLSVCDGVCVGTGGIVLSLAILIAMVAAVIISIAGSGFEMTRGLGFAFFGMYVAFCLQDILRIFVFSDVYKSQC